MNQCHGQVQAATHPNTEGTCPSIYFLSQSDQLEQLLRTRLSVCTSGSKKLALQCEKLQRLHEWIDTDLLQRYAKDTTHGSRLGYYIKAAHRSAPVRRQRQCGQDPDGRTLACPIGTKKTKDASLLYLEGNTVNGPDRARVVFGKFFDNNSLIDHGSNRPGQEKIPQPTE
jgi:hypothetical protein